MPEHKNLAIAYAMMKRRKKMAEGGEVATEAPETPDGASTGGEGSGIGGAGTGGAATGGASTGGAGTVTLTINTGAGSKGKGKEAPMTINISDIGGKTDAGSTKSGDGPGAAGEVGEKTKRQRAVEAFHKS